MEVVKRGQKAGYEGYHYIERKEELLEATKTVVGLADFYKVYFPKDQPTDLEVGVMLLSTLGCPCVNCRAQFDADSCIYKNH